MKKLLFILAIMISSVCVKAQAVNNLTFSGYGNTLDTVTNSGTRYATVTMSRPAAAFNMLVKVLKISGTVGGTISWQGSNNNSDYYTISTVSASDASANYSYSVSGQAPYKYYRFSWTGTGTMAASVQGTYVIIK